MQQGMTVYVVDGDRDHAQSVVRVLETALVRATARASIAEIFASVPRDEHACVVLERTADGGDGLEIFDELRAHGLHWPVIFLTAHGDIPHCASAMRRGAIDYFEKPVARTELLDALARAETQGAAWRRTTARHEVHCERLLRLTRREREVLELVLAGRRNKEIAAALSSQEATVKVHRSRLMRKLETRSLADLMRYRDYVVAAVGSTDAPPPPFPANVSHSFAKPAGHSGRALNAALPGPDQQPN